MASAARIQQEGDNALLHFTFRERGARCIYVVARPLEGINSAKGKVVVAYDTDGVEWRRLREKDGRVTIRRQGHDGGEHDVLQVNHPVREDDCRVHDHEYLSNDEARDCDRQMGNGDLDRCTRGQAMALGQKMMCKQKVLHTDMRGESTNMVSINFAPLQHSNTAELTYRVLICRSITRRFAQHGSLRGEGVSRAAGSLTRKHVPKRE